MVSITVYDNIFSEDYTQHSVEHGKTVKESYSFNEAQAVIHVNGIKVSSSHVLKDGDICSIHIVPTGAAAVVGGLLVGGFVGAWWVASGNAKKFFHWVGKGIKNAIADMFGIEDLSIANDQTSLQKIPTLKGAKNQSCLDKPIPLILGRHLITPYYCGSPYTLINPNDGSDGANQYLYALFIIGYSPLILNDIRIGELLLTSNNDNVLEGTLQISGESYFSSAQYAAEVEVRQSGEVSFYQQKVVQENLGIQLFNSGGTRTESIRFSASNPHKIEVEITINGLIGYSTAGAVEDRGVSIQIQWRPRNGNNSQWVDFPPISGSSFYLSGVSDISRSKNTQMRFISTYTFSYAEIMSIPTADVELRVIRVNEQATDGRTCDDVFWSAIRTWCFDKEASLSAGILIPQVPVVEKDRLKTVRLGLKIKAGDDLKGTLDKINLIASSIARTWNGSAWTTMEQARNAKTVSANPASVALLALQQPHIGNKPYTDEEIDLEGFGKLYEYCEIKGFTANGALITTMKEEDLIDKILYTGRSQLIIKDGKYSPCIDNERAYPVTVLNQQNTMSASNTKSFDVLPDGLRVSFINKDDGYQTNEVYVMRDGKSASNPDSTFKDIEMPFVTDVAQAWKLGRYILACMELRPETWTRKISIEGYALNIGSLVSVQDDTILVGMNAGGFIKEIRIANGEITGIVTDARFDMLEGYTYGVKIVQAPGTATPKVRTAQVVTHQGMVNEFEFVYPIPITENPIPSVDDLVAFGLYDKITKDAIVVGKTPYSDGTYEVTLVPYDEGINTADSGVIPAYDTKITKPLPMSLQEIVSRPQKIIPGAKGEQGAPGSGSLVAITNPLETNATYDDNQHGVYAGYIYIWTKTGTATGYWTIAASEAVSFQGINRYYSFDEVLYDENGQIICIDNSGNMNHALAKNAEITQGFRGKALSFKTRSSYIKI